MACDVLRVVAFLALVGLGEAANAPVTAQTAEVSGTWRVTWAASTRRERDGSLTVLRWGEAALVLTQRGDAVSGTWAALDRPTWPVQGIVAGDLLTFSGERPEVADEPGAPPGPVSGRWEARVEGARLVEGVLLLGLPRRGGEGVLELELPWRAERNARRPQPQG